jgi:hypothetical protein
MHRYQPRLHIIYIPPRGKVTNSEEVLWLADLICFVHAQVIPELNAPLPAVLACYLHPSEENFKSFNWQI